MKLNQILLLIVVVCGITASCSKSSDPIIPTVILTPKLGTTWVYQQDKFKADGINYITTTVTHKATSEVTLGGETWLKITDDTLATVYILKVKTGGLYQYANNASQLLCKMPAAVNDVYTAYNRGGNENFTVKQTGITVGSGSANYDNANMYEGYQGADLWDKIWYNDAVWFARRETWRYDPFLLTFYRKDSRLILKTITY